MDVTPKLLEDVEFREKFRGYDPEEVDDFLERVAIAFAQLQEKLRDSGEQIESANARAARAEARARDSSDADDTLRRTLVLAQRTADAAIKEAEENAAAIIAAAEAQARQHYAAAEDRAAAAAKQADDDVVAKLTQADEQAAEKLRVAEAQGEATLANAREQASRLLVDARQKADRMMVEAESTAVRQAEEKLARLTEDVGAMERRRDALAHDVNALDAHATVNRERLAVVLSEIRRLVEEPAGLGELSLPELKSDSFDQAISAHLARAAAPAPTPLDDQPSASDAKGADGSTSGATGGERAMGDGGTALLVEDAPVAAATSNPRLESTDTVSSVFERPTGTSPYAPPSRSPFGLAEERVSRDPVGRDEPRMASPVAAFAVAAPAPAPTIDDRPAETAQADTVEAPTTQAETGESPSLAGADRDTIVASAGPVVADAAPATAEDSIGEDSIGELSHNVPSLGGTPTLGAVPRRMEDALAASVSSPGDTDALPAVLPEGGAATPMTSPLAAAADALSADAGSAGRNADQTMGDADALAGSAAAELAERGATVAGAISDAAPVAAAPVANGVGEQITVSLVDTVTDASGAVTDEVTTDVTDAATQAASNATSAASSTAGSLRSSASMPGSTIPPMARPAADRPSIGLGVPRDSGDGGSSAAPPWMGMAPPPPPPPPPVASAPADATAMAPGAVPPPPPPAPAVEAPGGRDTFLDELRRAVGEEPDDDEAIRFFEDRDPTDPALRFFEGNDESRSRFRRR